MLRFTHNKRFLIKKRVLGADPPPSLLEKIKETKNDCIISNSCLEDMSGQQGWGVGRGGHN